MEDALKSSLIYLASIFILSSCSWHRELERTLIENDSESGNRSKTVSREKYDELLLKYEKLSKKYEELKERPAGSKNSLIDELKSSPVNTSSKATDSETVDLFPDSPPPQTTPLKVPDDIASQLELFRRGVSLKSVNRGEATKIFQELEAKAIPVIKVRAKYEVGSMLLENSQFDLALQVFEEIITKYSHSGVVIDALKGATVAADKLSIVNKKEQYASMLGDVFELK